MDGMGRNTRILLISAALVTVAVIAVIALFWSLQRSAVYYPNTSHPGSAELAHERGRDLTLQTEDGLELEAWLLEPAAEADRDTAVLYAPGNAGNRASRLGIGQELTDRGFTVLLMEYRGYGGNPGEPSEDGLAMDAVAAAQALADEGFTPERTVYLGESRGTAVVAALQATHPPAGVLLRSPFTEFADIAEEHLPIVPPAVLLREEFGVSRYLEDSEVPVSVLHGTADTVVPSTLSAQVAEDVGTLHEEIILDGVGHNDAEMFGAPVGDALEDLADAVVAESPQHE